MGARNCMGYKKKTLKKYNFAAYYEYDKSVLEDQFYQFKSYLLKKHKFGLDIKSSHIKHMLTQLQYMEEKINKLSNWLDLYANN